MKSFSLSMVLQYYVFVQPPRPQMAITSGCLDNSLVLVYSLSSSTLQNIFPNLNNSFIANKNIDIMINHLCIQCYLSERHLSFLGSCWNVYLFFLQIRRFTQFTNIFHFTILTQFKFKSLLEPFAFLLNPKIDI